jgi:hypothetical protein
VALAALLSPATPSLQGKVVCAKCTLKKKAQ